MPRKFKLTWQPGGQGRSGRWRKKYKAKVHYFPGGRGKSDRDAYDAALAEWERLKPRIDAAAPKSHQVDYERAIQEWELVLSWCRKNREEEMAELAIAKLTSLRKGLSVPKPKPVSKADTLDGQFDFSVRYPRWHESAIKIGNIVEEAAKSEPFRDLPGYDKYIAAMNEFTDGLHGTNFPSVSSVLVPNELDDWNAADPLKIQREIWHDRLEVLRRAAAPTDETLQAHIACFLRDKGQLVAADELTAGRVYALRLHLSHFMDWLGHETNVREINGKTLSDYYVSLLAKVDALEWSRSTAKDRLNSIKSFIRWLWQIEAIDTLPRIMDGKSNALKISNPVTKVVIFKKEEIATLLAKAPIRTQLYVLLMLNCGITQKDISDLDMSEVDWASGRISRKRSKTKKFAHVPEVSYLLWHKTLYLLSQERSVAVSGPVLLNANGKPLWYEEVRPDGSLNKIDNVRSAFERLKRKTKIKKPLKSLKKTSASLIRNNGKYAGLEGLFLGHAPQSMSDKHYTTVPQKLFDEAICWLAREYGIIEP